MQLQYKNLFINPLQCYTNRDRQTCVRIGHPVAACFPVKMPLLDMHHNEKPAVFPTQMINIEFDIKQRKTVFFISNFSYLFLSQDYFLFSSVFNSFLMFFFLFISSPPDGIIQSWLSMISLSFFFHFLSCQTRHWLCKIPHSPTIHKLLDKSKLQTQSSFFSFL